MVNKSEALELLADILEEVESRADVVDDLDGKPRPNHWMRVGSQLRLVLAVLKSEENIL